MVKDKNKYVDVSKEIAQGDLETEKVSDDCLVVQCDVHYRGKTNSYIKDHAGILMIVDKNGQVLDGVWHKDWTEIAPGIETCEIRKGTRSGNIEYWTMESIRIQRAACPVHIQFYRSYEYIDYDGVYSRSDSRRYWVRYES